MRRRKSGFLVRLFNLVYIAAAGISIYALCTRPIFKANVHVHFTQDKMASLLSGLFNKMGGSNEGEGEGEEEVKLVYRETERKDIKDYVTEAKIRTYFPNGYDVDIPLEISAKYAFDLNNTHVLDDLIQTNLGTIVTNVYNSVINPLTSLFKDIVEDFAVETLTDEINKQIAEHFPDGLPASEEEVQKVFDNVYSLLEGDEPVTVDTLAETILHGKDGDNSGVLDIINARGSKYEPYTDPIDPADVEADRTVEEKENQKYFLKNDEVEYQHNTDPYNSEVAYFDKDGNALDPQPEEAAVEADREAAEGEGLYYVGVITTTYVHNTAAYDSGTTYYKPVPYTSEDIDDQKIADQMAASLEGIDGLVTKTPKLCTPQPTQEQVEEDLAKEESERIYYVLDGNGDPVLPTEYSSEATYYTVDKVVNDVDSAMAALIDSFLNGGSGGGKAKLRAEEEHAELESSEGESKSIDENIKDYLYGLIPSNISESTGTVGEKAPYILLAVIGIFVLPWAWFALVTIIRTLRRDKCWTRPMIVLFWCLPQLVFGIGLTYGSKYIIPLLADKFENLREYLEAINFDARTGCLIPSFVYLGVFAMTLIYWIIRRPLKVQYKMEKRFGRGSRRPKQPRQPKQPKQKRQPGEPRQPRQPRQPLDSYEPYDYY